MPDRDTSGAGWPSHAVRVALSLPFPYGRTLSPSLPIEIQNSKIANLCDPLSRDRGDRRSALDSQMRTLNAQLPNHQLPSSALTRIAPDYGRSPFPFSERMTRVK